MSNPLYKYADIILFVGSVYALTFLFEFSGKNVLMALDQISPLIGVLLLLIFFPHRKKILRGLGVHRFGKWRWYGIAALTVVPIIFSFLFAWMVGVVDLPNADKFPPSGLSGNWERFIQIGKVWFSPVYLLMPFLWAVGEEVGWRGFLQPRLTDATSQKQAIMYTAFIWAVFHYPAFMIGYNDDGNILISLTLFTLAVIPLSIIMGWIRIKSFSVWPVIVLHTLVNQQRNFWAMVFNSKENGWNYLAGENGIITILVWLIIAIIIWGRLAKKKTKEELQS